MRWTVGAAAVAALLALARTDATGVINVRAGDDLQAALDRAQAGDVILVEAGARFVGNFVLTAKSGTGYITVRSAAPDGELPPLDTRATPEHASRFPKLQSPNSSPALRTAPGAHHWWIQTLEVLPSANGSGDLVRLGDGSSAQATLESVPHHLIIDRCYIHGDPGQPQRRGIALNSGSTQILNSWISEIKAAGQDSQAIGGWNGPGPYAIINNYLEAAGENLMLGGADPYITNLVPSDVVFRRNWVAKRQEWRGGSWQVKNLFELKNARNVVVEDNLFEYNWQAAQPGYAIVLTPRSQNGRAPWSVVETVTFRRNVVRHAAAAFNILGTDGSNPSGPGRRITISDNLVYDVRKSRWGGNGVFLLLGDGPSDVVVEHNTVEHSGTVVSAYGGSASSPTAIHGFVYRNNLSRHNSYGILGDGRSIGNDTLSAYFPGAIVQGNVLAGGRASLYPPGNFFPSVDSFASLFVNPDAGDYQLVSSSTYRAAATDGKAIGADAAALRSMLTAVLEGVAPRPTRPRNLRVVR